MKKNILALIMAVAMIFTLAIPSFASSTPNKIYFDSVPNGSVTANPTTATANQEVTLTVRPDTGYSFAGFLSGPDTTPGSEPNTYKFTMPDYSVSFKPSFVADKYEIKGTFVDSNGKVEFSKTADIVYNDDINITVKDVTSGYELSKLEYTVEGSQTPVSLLGKETFKMPASDINVVAEFAPIKYSVNLNYDSAYGNVTVENNKVAAGGTVRVLISPKDPTRYQIDEDALTVVASGSNTRPEFTWFDDASGNTAGITFTMPSTSVTVNVSFKRIQTDLRDIDIVCENRGDAIMYVNGSRVNNLSAQARWEDIVTIDVAPDNYYAVESIIVTKAGGGRVPVSYQGDYYSFEMPDENVLIDIYFYSVSNKYPYDLVEDYSSDGDCKFVVIGKESGLALETDVAYKGDTVRVYVTPEDGYVVDDVIAESDVFSPLVQYNSADDFYWFVMPSDDVYVTVTYDIDYDYEGSGDYDITPQYSSSKGRITVQDSANRGDTVYITVTPKSGYMLDTIEVYEDTWSETPVRVRSSSATRYYFTMPDEHVIVIATFIRDYDLDDDDDDYYDIFVAESDHGEVDVDDKAESGDTVKIYIDEDYGYTVDEIIVSRASGKTVTVTKKSTYWQFTMPSGDVFIEVSYKRGSSSSSNDGDYTIDLYYNDDYGYVDVVDSSDASKTVKIYIEPDDDNEVDEIIITRTNGKVIDYKYNSANDYYYFTMPASDVEIEVTFVGEVSDDEDDDFDGYYDIILDYDDDAGIVEVDDEAEEGEKVYIELDLDRDYTLDKIRVFEYSTGESVNVKKSSNTEYYFTMPEDDVFVVVTFDCDDYEDEDTYSINVESNDRYLGTADASRLYAAKGERVLVFIDPTSEYAVLDIIAERYPSGSITPVKKITNFCYEFTMPGSDIEVTVYFDEDRPLSYKEITLNYDKKMGEVYLSDEIAEEDDDVNIYVEPKDGYKVQSVSVKRTVGNKKVTCSKNKNGDYVFEMPNADVTVTVTFVKESTGTTTPTKPVTPTPSEPTIHICPAKPFTDVNVNEWYHDAIDYVIAYNLMNGYSATQFAPGDNVSRAMTVTVLWRIAGQPASTAALPYTDVAEGQWYTEAVRWAAANGLLTNVAAGSTFEPNSTITREQFASVIYRYEKLIGNGYTNGWTHPLKFSDLNLMSAWALEPLTWCNEFGILNGVGYDRIDPQGTVTRAQLAQILLNLDNLDK